VKRLHEPTSSGQDANPWRARLLFLYNPPMPANATIPGHLPPLAGLGDPLIRAMALATTGDTKAIRQLASTSEGIDAVLQNRLAPLLTTLAHERGLEAPEPWKASLRQTAIMRMLLDRAMANLGAVLDTAGIRWVPLKGMGLPARFYPSPECRPTTDLDVLVPETSFLEARDVLRAEGWDDMHPGPLHEDFLLREGYNWQARHAPGVMLELHFRLWGPVDSELPAAILETAQPAPQLGTMARLSPPAESYVVGACHLWNSPRPVALLYFFDLRLLGQAAGDASEFVDSVTAMATRHDLQLFVGMAAAITARLWPDPASQRIAATLLHDLRPAERALILMAQRRPPRSIPLGALVLARLLSGRKSRTGWRAPFRRIWPHPAIFQDSAQKGPIATLRRRLTKNK